MSSQPTTGKDVTAHDEHKHPIELPSPSYGPLLLGLGAMIMGSGLAFIRNMNVLDRFQVDPIGVILLLGGFAMFLAGITKVSNFKVIPEHAPSMGVNNRILGMWVFLASEIMFFAGLIATFLGYKQRAGDVSQLLNVPLMTIGTFILLTSSFAAVSALSALQQNKIKVFRNWLITTMVLGVLFLGIEMLEWMELFGHGVTHQTLFGSAFFTLTGFHGLHVMIGLVWMIFLLVRTLRNTMSAKDSMGLEVFGLYWHFVDIVWIILFTIVYLI
jgi:heme/copper-type cytochrome/quinol oxidase subunit 3